MSRGIALGERCARKVGETLVATSRSNTRALRTQGGECGNAAGKPAPTEGERTVSTS